MAVDNIDEITRIELDPSNLFSLGTQVVFNDGTGKLIRDKVVYEGKEGDSYYTVKLEDTLSGIAYRSYKDQVELPSHYWWVIADVNNIKNPLDLSGLVGVDILVPDILSFLLVTNE